MTEDFQIGDRVDVNGQLAIVRYIGPADFAPGEWVGVELDIPDGKNNGSVQGVKYFECADKYGKFYRSNVPRLVERAPQQAQRPQARQSLSRIASIGQMKGATKMSPSSTSQPPSRTGTPTSTAGSSTRPPASVSMQPTRTTTPSRPGSMGPAQITAISKTSMAGRRGSQMGGQAGQNLSLSPSPAGVPRPGSGASSGGSRTPVDQKVASPTVPTARSISGQRLSVSVKSISAVNAFQKRGAAGSSGETDAAASSKAIAQKSHGRKESTRAPLLVTAPQAPASPELHRRPANDASREMEDLKTKIKVLEKKRLEDREKLQEMEQIRRDKEKFESIIQKLQAKYQPQAEENRELRKHLKEAEEKVEELETSKAEHEVIVEIATLDREMAEEQVEYLKTEVELYRSKAEELEMEIEILREENKELGQEMSPEEKTSAGWIQMVKQNERLKDALLRLKDITQQTEIELKDNIKGLQEDNEQLSHYKEQYEQTKDRLYQAESAVEDLRQQLDTALGAEEMLEELTDRNLSMNEQIEELRATIEDLEALKELADELEINHIETEKQMQEELDYKDLFIAEQTKRVAQLDTSNEQAEYTITRFRDLVNTLQSDLEDLRASQQITEQEAEELTARSRSMMDINLKLQLSATKAQNKTIDLELRRMEAEEAMEHLQIVQMFLPEAFLHERDSILSLLRFRRVAFKSHLLNTFIKERISANQPQNGSEDSFMAACDICDKLTWISAMCERFTNCISGCNVHQFNKFRDALHELDPVERALNSWIDSLRRDDLKEKQCAIELQRTMAVISHLGEIHLPDTLEGFAQHLQMRVQLMQSHMECAAAAVSHIKYMVSTKVNPTIDEEELASIFAKKSDAIISHSRGAKVVVSKILRSLSDLQTRSLSLAMETRQSFEECEEAMQKIAAYARALGDAVADLLYHEEGRTEPVTFAELQSVMYKTTERTLMMAETDTFSAFGKELRSLTNMLVDLGSMASDLDMTAEFERAPAPWIVRAQELKNTKIVNVDVEDKCRRLKEEIRELVTQIRVREKSLDEAAVKIEHLESRMSTVGKQSERIEKLEKSLEDSVTHESKLEASVEQLNNEILQLERDVVKWKKTAQEKRTAGDIDRTGQERAVATAREVASLKSEITNLSGAVNFLREENARIKQVDLSATNSWLFEPIKPSAIPVTNNGVHVGKRDKATREKLWKEEITREGKDLLSELVSLATESKIIDLRETPKNRNAWRPVRETPGYIYWRQRERYEALAGWRDSIVERAGKWDDMNIPTPSTPVKGRKEKRISAVAKIQAYHMYPGLEMKRGLAPKVEVVIREPESWDVLKESLGLIG
ncbi:dynein associated protein-domain-containing protein [Terfezia claveryi]|nr:dynein associated protein-domain-containing protein [Terfezia claveryi]